MVMSDTDGAGPGATGRARVIGGAEAAPPARAAMPQAGPATSAPQDDTADACSAARTRTRAKEKRLADRGDRILDALATLIARWGYGKTTVDDIAREAGVAKGTVYLHWPSK